MTTRRFTVGGAMVVAALVVIWFARNSRAATPTPAYRVIDKEDNFELRDYPALVLVSGRMQERSDMNGTFRRLFGFISGQNDRREKIAMTSPVLISTGKSENTMSFIMPADQPGGATPGPRDPSLQRSKQPAGRFAAVRYRGSWNESRSRRAAADLRTWMNQRGLVGAGGEQVALYDPPFMPPFLRRNEVLIRVR